MWFFIGRSRVPASSCIRSIAITQNTGMQDPPHHAAFVRLLESLHRAVNALVEANNPPLPVEVA